METMELLVRGRLEEYRAYRRMSVAGFEAAANLTPTLWKKTKSVSAETAAKLLLAFPDLSAEWVMRGRGDMLLPEEGSHEDARKVNITEDGYKAQIALYERMISDKDAIIKALLNRCM